MSETVKIFSAAAVALGFGGLALSSNASMRNDFMEMTNLNKFRMPYTQIEPTQVSTEAQNFRMMLADPFLAKHFDFQASNADNATTIAVVASAVMPNNVTPTVWAPKGATMGMPR